LKPRAITYRLLAPPLLAYAKLDHYAARLLGAASRCIEGFVLTAFDAAELTDLTISIYDQASRRFEGSFSWEPPWFERALPRSPARVLVAAAGEGREALALRSLGYDVDAFEPGPSLPLRAAVGAGLALQGDFADLVRAARGDGGPLAALAERRYDAILLGWATFARSGCAPARSVVCRVSRAVRVVPFSRVVSRESTDTASERAARAHGERSSAGSCERRAAASRRFRAATTRFGSTPA
jgi:hypothetical protein